MTTLPDDTISLAMVSEFIGALGADAECNESRLRMALAVALDDAVRARGPMLGSPAAFVQYLASRLPGVRSAEQEVASLHAADLALARACVSGNSEAIAVLEAQFLGLVSAAGKKLSMTTEQCDELRQTVRMKLLVEGPNGGLPKLSIYAGTGPLRSWVYATGLRTGLNELRRIGRAPIAVGDEQLLVAMPDRGDDQQLQYMKRLYRGAFREAFRASIGELEDRLANVLRHYYLDEMTLEEIGALYRVHKTTAMRWVNRAHVELEMATKIRMTSHLELGPSEVESVLRMIQSGIHIGLASVLAPLRNGSPTSSTSVS